MELKYILMVLMYQTLEIIDEKYIDYIIKYNEVTKLTLGQINRVLVTEYDMWIKRGQ